MIYDYVHHKKMLISTIFNCLVLAMNTYAMEEGDQLRLALSLEKIPSQSISQGKILVSEESPQQEIMRKIQEAHNKNLVRPIRNWDEAKKLAGQIVAFSITDENTYYEKRLGKKDVVA